MNYKIKGRIIIEGDIFELEFESIDEYIERAIYIQSMFDEGIELYYNDIPLELAANIRSEVNREMIEEQIREIDEDYEEY